MFAEAFKHAYNIKNMEVVDKLESQIGFHLEKIKSLRLVSKLNYVYIDEIDRKLYELFLKIKSKFNQFSPINKDQKVMMIIGKTVETLIKKYKEDNNLTFNDDINKLEKKINQLIEEWLREHEIHFLVNSYPLNMIEESQFIQTP